MKYLPLSASAGLVLSVTAPLQSASAQHTVEGTQEAAGAAAQSGETDLAKQLANPIASLISVPIQSNYDFGIGPGDGTRSTTNIQPVIPFELNEHWNLISRTILPVIEQNGIDLGGNTDEFGLGDTVQSLFFSPKESDPIWGVGPVFLIPTATDSVLGSEQWGAGPTAVVLKQSGSWTCGALANHIWSFAGDDGRDDVNATFLQPFVSYIADTKTTFNNNLAWRMADVLPAGSRSRGNTPWFVGRPPGLVLVG